jgi:hypothetical protein
MKIENDLGKDEMILKGEQMISSIMENASQLTENDMTTFEYFGKLAINNLDILKEAILAEDDNDLALAWELFENHTRKAFNRGEKICPDCGKIMKDKNNLSEPIAYYSCECQPTFCYDGTEADGILKNA